MTKQTDNKSVEVRLVQGLLNLLPRKTAEEMRNNPESIVSRADGYLKLHSKLWIGRLRWVKTEGRRHRAPRIDVYPFDPSFWRNLKPLRWAVNGNIEFVRNSSPVVPNIVFCCNDEFRFKKDFHRTLLKISEGYTLAGNLLIHGEEMTEDGVDICGVPWADIIVIAEYIRQWNKNIFETADEMVASGQVGPGMIDAAYDETSRKMNPMLGQALAMVARFAPRYEVPVERHEEVPKEEVDAWEEYKPSSIIL